MSEAITGGCQCGAVRYALSDKPESEFCHCGMCRRATGGVFAALASVPKASVTWTREEPAYYASSTAVKRGFCPSCGTPLTFAYDDSAKMDITIGSLDNPELAGPLGMHFAVEHKLSWVEICDSAPQHRMDAHAESPVYKPGYASHQFDPGESS